MDHYTPTQPPVRYCLYARKSSEDDERQALSIDSQTKEMTTLAEREGFEVVEILKESHSAKDSGGRVVYNQLLNDIRTEKFNGILTWAPDRLSRNAGDLGTLVDLMDQGKLVQIRTASQTFTNNPNEKFLLMILCSQAKLENDNKSVNVKRGFKAKVEMGYRPNMSPLGYLHDTNSPKGQRKALIDQVRAPIVKQMFEHVANDCWSGRRIQKWFDDEVNFRSRTDKLVSLSTIYLMLSNPFYTGRYEFPKGSGNWYQGKHEPIISQELFDKAQENLKLTPKGIPGTKEFAFTRLMSCGTCGSGITAEEKIKKLKDGTVRRYVYYHCSDNGRKECSEPAIREEELVEQLNPIIEKLKFDEKGTLERIKADLNKLKKLLEFVVGSKQALSLLPKIDLRIYTSLILKDGSREEKRELLSCIDTPLILHHKVVGIHSTTK